METVTIDCTPEPATFEIDSRLCNPFGVTVRTKWGQFYAFTPPVNMDAACQLHLGTIFSLNRPNLD